MNKMQDLTGREMEIVTRNVARDLCRAALGYTIVAPKVVKKYFTVLHHRYTGKSVIFPNKSGLPRFKVLRIRGFAKSGWSACLTNLGVKRQEGGGQASLSAYRSIDGDGKKWGKVVEIKNSGNYGLLVSNEVPFIEDLDSGRNRFHTPLHTLEKSISDVNAKMEKYLSNAGKNIVRKSGMG